MFLVLSAPFVWPNSPNTESCFLFLSVLGYFSVRQAFVEYACCLQVRQGEEAKRTSSRYRWSSRSGCGSKRSRRPGIQSPALQLLQRPSSLFKFVFGLSQFKAHPDYLRTHLRHANSSLSSISQLFPVWMRGMERSQGSSPPAPWGRGLVLSGGCLPCQNVTFVFSEYGYQEN